MRTDKRSSHKADKKTSARGHKQGVVGYSKKSALLEEAITHMNTGKYGRSSAALKELLALDPQNTEARRLFATLHLRLGSLVTAREAFESLANEAIGRQDYWLAESLLREYLAAGPRCIPFLEQLAHVYEEKGDAMAAVAELGKAVEILLEDPDPDHPEKPSQLYGKIRELAPASPVAFQFASSFDIQTGEFRLLPRSVSDNQPAAEELNGRPIIASDPAGEANAPAEVMPWEQLDESSSPDPSPFHPDESEWNAPKTLPDVSTAINGIEPKDTSRESVFSQQESDSTEPSSVSIDSVLLQEAESAAEATPAELREQRAPIVELTVSPLISSEPAESSAERAADISWEATAPVEPSSVPSRMPWEHVADPALQIVETEAASVPIPSPDTDSVHHPEASTSTIPVEAAPIPATEPEPAPAPSSPTSFSWNAIFDSAWKIAVGTTAPSSSVVVKEADGTEPISSGEQPEPPVVTTGQAEATEEVDQQTNTIEVADVTSSSHPLDVPPAFEPSMHESVAEPLLSVPQPDLEEAPPSFPSPPTVLVSEVEEPAIPSSPVVENVQHEPAETFAVSPPESVAEPIPMGNLDYSPPTETPVEQEERQPTLPGSPTVDLKAGGSVSPTVEPPAHWTTGEAAVQQHRPSARKRKGEKESAETPEVAPPSSPARETQVEPVSELSRGWESKGAEEAEAEAETAVVAQEVAPELIEPKPPDSRPEWAQASDSISLDQPVPPAPIWQEPPSDTFYTIDEPARSSAASAVDVLFGSTGQGQAIQTKERFASPKQASRFRARLARLRLAVSSFILSCFSTTRAFVLLCISLVVLGLATAALAAGMLAIVWMVMEESPTQHYQGLTSGPQRQITDPKKNGFLLLMGFDAPSGTDPLQAGYERKVTEHDVASSRSCMLGQEAKGGSGTGASSNVIDGWFKGADPLTQLKGQPETVRSLVAQEATSLARYQQWMPMSFDDWGFGQILSPNCPHILLTHRLFLLDGFNQDTAVGINRLEKDMEAWRSALGQSKTLMVKMMAATAVQDDVALTSALLMRPETDSATINRLAKVVRPLDQLELSVRWPMQSHFIWATGNVAADLKKDRTEERPFHVSVAAAMPLPVQRRANAYAEYYDAANKAVAEGRYVNLPKASQFLRTSASNLFDYWANPIEHVIGIEPLPSWDPYVGRMVETDAQLRLASLQVWVRRGPSDGDVLGRLAKAGQAYYDPFTGLPMLVNQPKRLLYSVGRDGKDQEGDRHLDVVVAIPSVQSAAAESKRGSK